MSGTTHLYAEHLGGLVFLSFVTIPIAAILFLVLRRGKPAKQAFQESVVTWIILTNIGLIGVYLLGVRSAAKLEAQGMQVPDFKDHLGVSWRIIFGVFDVVIVLALTNFKKLIQSTKTVKASNANKHGMEELSDAGDLKTNCPHCNTRISFGPEWFGKTAPCPTCQNMIHLPHKKKV